MVSNFSPTWRAACARSAAVSAVWHFWPMAAFVFTQPSASPQHMESSSIAECAQLGLSACHLEVRLMRLTSHLTCRSWHFGSAAQEQACTLHLLKPETGSRSAGQALPPCCGCTVIARTRCVMPPPHVLEHGSHAAHADTTQSIGHVRVLQRCISLQLMTSQLLPPPQPAVQTL